MSLNKSHRQHPSHSPSPDLRALTHVPFKNNQLIQFLKNKEKLKSKQEQQNEQMDREVALFKNEIEAKFRLSKHNQLYTFPYEPDESSDTDDPQLHFLHNVTRY